MKIINIKYNDLQKICNRRLPAGVDPDDGGPTHFECGELLQKASLPGMDDYGTSCPDDPKLCPLNSSERITAEDKPVCFECKKREHGSVKGMIQSVCGACGWKRRNYITGHVEEKVVPCVVARGKHGTCGIDGKLFERLVACSSCVHGKKTMFFGYWSCAKKRWLRNTTTPSFEESLCDGAFFEPNKEPINVNPF